MRRDREAEEWEEEDGRIGGVEEDGKAETEEKGGYGGDRSSGG